MGPLKTLVATLVDNKVLEKFEKGSKTLIDAIAANDTKFNEIKTLIETVEENKDLYTQLKEKIDTFLETDNPLSDHVKPVLTELAGLMGEIANTHPILKLVWLAVAAVYKAAKAMKDFDDKLLQLIEAFQKGNLFTNASLEGSLVAVDDANKNLLKDALETYIKCLNELITVCTDYYQRPKPDKKKMGFFQKKPKLPEQQWSPTSGTVEKLDTILTRLKEAKNDLSQAQGAATFTIAARQAARQATGYTLEQMDLLKNRLKPVNFVSFEKKKVTGRTWFVDLADNWLKGQTEVFWFSGPAGCGKSRMAERAFDFFENGRQVEEDTKKHDAVFFAFNHKDYNDPKTCIETLAYSIAEKYNTDTDFEITKTIFMKCETWSKEPTKKPRKLKDLINDLLVAPLKGKKKNMIIVIDALDECEPQSLEEFLTILDSHSMRQFRFFVTSRDSVKLSNAEEHSFDPMSKENLDDLTDYAEGRLKLVMVLSNNPDQVKNHAIDLVHASEGIFLNASITLDILGIDYSQYKTFETEWNSLMEKKLTSDSLYDVVWSKVEDNETVRKLVGIMLSLKRPLKVNGLSTLIDMDTNLLQMTLMHIVPLLKGVLNNYNNTVQFKHRSTVEFLEKKRVPLQLDLLAKKCMDIIGALLGSLDVKDYPKAVNSFASGTNKFNFGLQSDATLYFIENWTDTLNASTQLIESTFQQFAVKYGNFLLAACIKMQNETFFLVLVQNSESINNLENSHFFTSPVLYEAAKLGLSVVCKCLLESESETVNVHCIGNANDQYGAQLGQTPLHIAVRSNHLDTVKVLVEHNADIFAKDNYSSQPYTYSLGPIRQFFDSILEKRKERNAVETMSPLQIAIYDKNSQLFKALWTESAMLEPNLKDFKNTGFHYLAMYYDSEILEYVSKLSSFTSGLSCVNSDGETPLLLAAKKGNKETVELLLKCGARIELQDNGGATPLAHGASNGHKETVEFLLEFGAQIESQNKNGNTPLALAAFKGQKEIVELLLQHNPKANIESQNKKGETPLSITVQQGHKETVEFLLIHGAKIESQKDDGNTPLALAAKMGHKETVEILLHHRANIESQDKIERTPLALAAEMGHKETVELLLHHKANIELQNKYGDTPLSLAAYMGHKETVELLLHHKANIESKNKDKKTPLALAAYMGHKETVELLLDCKAKIESQDNEGDTPLAHAAYMRHKETMEALLDFGANIESKDNYGHTPLGRSAHMGDKETVEFLLHHEANIEAQNENGNTPLALAAYMGRKETVELLLHYKANIESQDKYGDTPLALAAYMGRKETVELLLHHKANIESQNENRDTPLALAAYMGRNETVELLLHHKANIEWQDDNGDTPLALAAYRGHNETAKLLLDCDAKIESQNKDRQTPLAQAAYHGHEETVKLLLEQCAKTESPDNFGNTPLALAAEMGYKDTVELLLDHGAKIDSRNKNGETPLELAAINGKTETVLLLMNHGANIESKDKNGRTLLANAAAEGRLETVELLHECGASIECKDNKGLTPLVLAVQNGHKETADFLRSCGAMEPTIIQNIRSMF
ncbi:hypothetical protein HDU79_009885, partial [Rhizoclosmatium sp. JEL0117]